MQEHHFIANTMMCIYWKNQNPLWGVGRGGGVCAWMHVHMCACSYSPIHMLYFMTDKLTGRNESEDVYHSFFLMTVANLVSRNELLAQ